MLGGHFVMERTRPQLSCALRVLSSKRPDSLTDNNDIQFSSNLSLLADKIKKQKLLIEADSHNTWAVLTKQLTENCDKNDINKVLSSMRELSAAAKDLTGIDDDPEAIEGVGAFLYQLFATSPDMCRSHGESIKRQFGPYPAKVANNVSNIIKQLLSYQSRPVVTSSTDDVMKEEFGNNIPFTFSDNLITNNNNYVPSIINELLDDDVIDDCNHQLITKGLMHGMRKRTNKETSHVTSHVTTIKPNIIKFGRIWLERVCQSCDIQGLQWQQLYTQLFDLLIMKGPEVETEIVELLGFDKMDTIQELLTNRQLIVDTVLNDKTPPTINNEKSSQAPTLNKSSRARGPPVGSTVTVQSVEEKEIRKQLRKEEKKDGRARQKRDKEASHDSHVTNLISKGYDPHILRQEREYALEDASRRPLFATTNKKPSKTHIYPNVFDSLAEIKMSSAVLAGNKVVLPESAVRSITKTYEEIRINHAGLTPPIIAEKIRIQELDDIAKIGFSGMKTLNMIQSRVFDTAYYSNENMLISAPTGAGKTNIALLTVLKEIKNNLNDANVLMKDQFKIIYVAPMKALASEMVASFSKRLLPLGVTVRELTGDMQLTKQEIQKTQMIVTTPEKWDVVTRKSTGDVSLAQIVRLLIIDEIHLLHEDRGAVIECLVARTLRQVESSQRIIRIVGLSATLPNYCDVAQFLNVNMQTGLYVFDERFRAVPLSQIFVGIKTMNKLQQLKDMDEVCYEKCYDYVRMGHQVMVFVHSRNGTVKTATTLKEMAAASNESEFFRPDQSSSLGTAQKQIDRSRYKPLKDLFADGFAVHHAGMPRHDRNLVEKLYLEGLIKVLVCTATLAWGVNLPVHAVIIKGTQIYDAKKGSFVDLGILDVCQIFGRAGRPQFDTYGEGTIITGHDKMAHYLSLMTRQHDIESQLINSLADCLNAEISLGTVSNIEEGIQWLKYTYLYVRIRRNPLAYGINHYKKQDDPFCDGFCNDLIVKTSIALDKAKMIRFMEKSGLLSATDLGRTASHYYIKHATIEIFNGIIKSHMTEGDAVAMVSKSHEFEQIKVRDDEVDELEEHLHGSCMLPIKKGGADSTDGKVNILLQTFIGRGIVNTFSLVSDIAYVAQNASRIMRGLFEICLKKGWSSMSSKLLELSKCLEHRMWHMEHPLKQFSRLSVDIVTKLEERNATMERLRDMTENDIGHLIHHVRMGKEVKRCVDSFPQLSLAATIQPITRTVLKVNLLITPNFNWDDRIHGNSCEGFWIWVEDPNNDHMYYSENFLLHRKQVLQKEQQELIFTIPIFDPLPPQYYIKVTSDHWLGSQSTVALSFQHLILPELHPPHTKLLDLHPLPIKALKNTLFEEIYKFKFFNPIQTQTFHTLYHSDTNVLLGAPTGSGKTVAAELAMFRVFNVYPDSKCVYIAPLKALVRERITDWSIRLQQTMKKRVIELTGDVTPDIRSIKQADVIVTTPEKWDGISRSWQNRSYVKAVRLIIIDEIHLLGDDRGPVLEVIVSRTNYIASHTKQSVRVVGLSTALANASDLANWLGITDQGLFTFHPAVRPVQLEVHISGYPGKHYCPRMATMNKPSFTAIKTYSPNKPVLIFVSSRRQTRLTAFDLVSFVATEGHPKQWLHLTEQDLQSIIATISDTNLKHVLSFGIGLHHAGLKERDRKIVEELFVNQKIQILIATSTLAWGVNFPAHLVVVKGTEYFDGKTQRYVDYPITDVLQMMGRAGRPQYDDKGVAMILVHDVKKDFYKKFLYEPFPVESNLLAVMANHFNAEIVAGTITSKQDAVDYITWTYFFRRLIKNPSYYHLDDASSECINKYLSTIVNDSMTTLEKSYCITIDEDNRTIRSEVIGCIASYYYLHHESVKMFKEKLTPFCTIEEIITILSEASEYNELPVRHNEDKLNSTLSTSLPLRVDPNTFDNSHTKAFLLLQAHYCRIDLPIVDYITDTKSVLDQALRILQALLDICSNEGWLQTSLGVMNVIQMCLQARWSHDSSLLCLPHIEEEHIDTINRSLVRHKNTLGVNEITCLPELLIVNRKYKQFLSSTLDYTMTKQQINQIDKVLSCLPLVKVQWSIKCPNNIIIDNTNIIIPCGLESVLEVTCTVLDRKANDGTKAFTPYFPKPKDEGWFFVLGNSDTKELIAIKRVGLMRRNHTHRLVFQSPDDSCHVMYTLYIISDCYIGLDQQFDININFK